MIHVVTGHYARVFMSVLNSYKVSVEDVVCNMREA